MGDEQNRATAVYRFFDKTGRLLYVGIAYDPAERWKYHAAKTRWWKDAVDNTIEWYDTRAEAERAEEVALRYEKPIYNKAGSVTPYQGSTAKRGMKLPRKIQIDDDVWADYEKLCAEKGRAPEEDIEAHVKRSIRVHRAEQRRFERSLKNIAES
ncbi:MULTISPECIES: GIY-YIG nuclease family protein [Streptomyces]|uniref:GIY-YIG nuclease family protein n=1 Tax=Streptomyces galilaeus TaxID=33899 RepID=A0ABW9IMZ2_STRGJ